jgi:phosphoribosylformimino-5-aminoimidazole carboxamide ribotide isomerase
LGFRELYIADLDAILSGASDFELFTPIVAPIGLSLLVDAGVNSIERADRLLKSGVSKFIIGTETLLSKDFIAEAVERFGNYRVVVSLDLKDGQVLTKAGVDGSIDPLHLLQEFELMGVSEVIVLDLARVGSNEGVETGFLKRAINKTNLSVYVGGGVRNIADLIELKALGATGTLVATALHTGRVSVEDLKREGFL